MNNTCQTELASDIHQSVGTVSYIYLLKGIFFKITSKTEIGWYTIPTWKLAYLIFRHVVDCFWCDYYWSMGHYDMGCIHLYQIKTRPVPIVRSQNATKDSQVKALFITMYCSFVASYIVFGVKWAECSLIIGTGCRVQVFSLILDSSVGLSASIQSAGDLVSRTSGSNPAFIRGTQLVSFRFEYRLPVPEHRN